MVTDKPTQSPRRTKAVFRAIADPTRRAILVRLRSEADGLTVEEIAAAFPVSRPAISRHLRILHGAALVRPRKQGRQRVYRVTPEPLAHVDAWLSTFRVSLAASLVRLKEHLEAPTTPTPPLPLSTKHGAKA